MASVEMTDNHQSAIVPENQVISPWHALIAGAAAGLAVDISLFPIDTIKTRLQSSEGFWKAGGFKGVYKGLSAAASGSAPGAALFFLTYESSKPLVHEYVMQGKDSVNSNPLTHMLAGGIAETAACLVRVPTEIIKQNMQTGQYQQLSIALRDTFGRYGIRGFYVGYGTTVAREIPFSFIQFPIWERLKLIAANLWNDGQEIDPYQSAICGSIAGAIAAGTTTPLDVIKTRLMLRFDTKGVPYNGFMDCVSKIYAQEGPTAYFKGIVPRMSWIFVGGFFFFGAYEKTKKVISTLQ